MSRKISKSRKPKKSEKGATGNVASQKRFVSAVKVFLNDAEKKEILAQVGNFKSISNYIRHHLGLAPNAAGRKRRYTESALDLETDDLEQPLIIKKPLKTKKSAKLKQTKITKNAEEKIPSPVGKLSSPVKMPKVSESASKPGQRKIPTGNGQLGLWDELNS